MANGNEGSTPALGDAQARKLLQALPADTLRGVRDRAILGTLLYHGMRREELCGLRIRDIHRRQGGRHFPGQGKARSGPVRDRACDDATWSIGRGQATNTRRLT
jgi:integrase